MQPDLDAAVSEADLDAALEMLLFMWVATGRDPQAVTTEGMAAVRGRMVQQFAQFSPQFQYTLANAQPIYANLRGAWLKADVKSRARTLPTFTANLNALGFTPGTVWTAWEAKSRGELISGLVTDILNTAQENVWVKP